MNEKNLVKRYLLWWSEDEFMPIGGMVTGAVVGMLITLVLGLMDIAVLKQPVWLYVLATTILGAFVFQFIKWKYISRAEDTSATALLRQVDMNKVVAAKAMFTKNCLPVALPVIKNNKVIIEMDITRRKYDQDVHFFSRATIYLAERTEDLLQGFDPEKLFRIVQSERGRQSIHSWLLGRLLDVQESELIGAIEVGETPEQFAKFARSRLWSANYEAAIARLGNVKAVDIGVRYEIDPA